MIQGSMFKGKNLLLLGADSFLSGKTLFGRVSLFRQESKKSQNVHTLCRPPRGTFKNLYFYTKSFKTLNLSKKTYKNIYFDEKTFYFGKFQEKLLKAFAVLLDK